MTDHRVVNPGRRASDPVPAPEPISREARWRAHEAAVVPRYDAIEAGELMAPFYVAAGGDGDAVVICSQNSDRIDIAPDAPAANWQDCLRIALQACQHAFAAVANPSELWHTREMDALGAFLWQHCLRPHLEHEIRADGHFQRLLERDAEARALEMFEQRREGARRAGLQEVGATLLRLAELATDPDPRARATALSAYSQELARLAARA